MSFECQSQRSAPRPKAEGKPRRDLGIRNESAGGKLHFEENVDSGLIADPYLLMLNRDKGEIISDLDRNA